MKSVTRLFVFLILAFTSPSRCLGKFNLEIGLSSGAMIQPSSQYYHLIYGSYLRGNFSSFLFQFDYIERPILIAEGFSDQESATFFHTGKQFFTYKIISIDSYMGYGNIIGFIKQTDHLHPALPSKRSYSISGFSLLVDLSIEIKAVRMSISHQLFTGYNGSHELKSYVGWPYNFFLIKLGYIL